MEATVVNRGYIGIMEKKMETTISAHPRSFPRVLVVHTILLTSGNPVRLSELQLLSLRWCFRFRV